MSTKEEKKIVDAAPEDVKITDADTENKKEETKGEEKPEETKKEETKEEKKPWWKRALYPAGIIVAAIGGGALGFLVGGKAGFAKGKKSIESLPGPGGFGDTTSEFHVGSDDAFGSSDESFGGFDTDNDVTGTF